MSTERPPKVFISRTTAGLAALAEKVAVVLRERGFEIIHQPDFGMEWRKIRHMLMEKVREADAVLCLVGPAYGAAPRTTIPEFRNPDTGREEYSYTQIEYLIARQLLKPTFTLLIPYSLCTFVHPGDRGTPEQQQLQSDFIRDVIGKDEHVFRQFQSEADLLGAIRSALIPIPITSLPPASPANIPFRSIGNVFTGRADTLRSLRESLVSAGSSGNSASKRPAVQVIHGVGGVGKTRLTVEYAHSHGADYTARLFVRGGSAGALDESLASLAGLFILNLEEQDEKETEVCIAAVLRWLAAHPGYLLVIDNVDTDEAHDHVLEVLSRLPAGHVLLTSRLHTWPGDILRTPLGVLSDTDSRDLLLKYRSSPKAPAPDTDAADALSLAHDLDGLALALEQAAAYLNVLAITIAEYHERWKSNAARVRAWHDPAQMGYPASVATTWLTSFEQLAPASQAFLNLLSWLAPDPIPRFLLKPLAEKKLQPDPLTGTDPYKALGELIHFSLANPAQNGSAFAVHRLIQQVTRERQEPPSPAPALIVALGWVNEEMPQDADDVRTWPVASPLAPHAIEVATSGADRGIAMPSSVLLHQAALFLTVRADFKNAEPLIRRALEVDEIAFGGNHFVVALRLNNLAVLLRDTNRLVEAEPLMRRALAIDEASSGKNHPDVARDLANLAGLLQATNRHAEAEPLMRRALAINEACYGRDHSTVATSLNSLARLLQATNRFGEVEKMYRRALTIDEACYGTSHPEVAIVLNNLAEFLQATNRHVEAEPLMRRALAIDEASYGKDHPRVAEVLNSLAILLQITNRLSEAEPMYHRALAIIEASYGRDHSKVATNLNNLAELLRATNRLAEAEPMYRRALTIDEASLGMDHPKVAACLVNLAELLRSTGRLAEAEPMIRRALAIDEDSFGKNHPDVARDLNALALLLKATNRIAEAEPMYRRALAIAEASYSGNHPLVATYLNNLGQVLMATNRFAEAEPKMRRALAIDEASYGNEHPKVAIRLNNLTILLHATNRLSGAEPLMRRAVEILLKFTKDNGHQHPLQALYLDNYFALLMATGHTEMKAKEKIRALMALFRA